MLEHLSYEKLNDVLKNVKPYRNTDRYPLAKRTHRGKYMVPKEVNGKIEFHVCYYWKHTPVDITNAEYMTLSSEEQTKYNWFNQPYSHMQQITEAERMFRRYDREPNPIVIIRDDNTAEFMPDYFGQGDRGFLSFFSYGYFTTNVRKGGGLYKQRGKLDQPVFKGLRLNITTHEPHESCNYEVISRVVDRKKAKHVLVEYERPFTIAEAMLKGYSLETFFTDLNVMQNMVNDKYEGESFHTRGDKYKEEGMDLLKTDEVGGAMLLMIHKDYSLANRAERYVRSNVMDSWARNYGEPIDYFLRMKKTVHREIYKQCNALKERVHKHGDHIPTSTWDVEVKLNGNTVKPY